MTESKQKSGCLFGWLANLLEANQERDVSRETDSDGQQPTSQLKPPRVMVSDRFFTPAEMSFYRVLQQCVGTDSTILCQVSLQQLFFFTGRGQTA